MNNAVLILRGLEELYPENQFIGRLRDSIECFPLCNWEDAMSRGQITSKQWIIHQLIMMGKTDLGCVIICGGWVGILSRLLLDCPNIDTHFVNSIDLDGMANRAALNLNVDYIENDFCAFSQDMLRLNYRRYDTIINTSCEHLDDFYRWQDAIPRKKLVILQSNNFTDPEEHVNCVQNAKELAEQANISEVLYSGSLPCIKYTRYMVIGIK